MSNQDQNSIEASSIVLEDGRRLSYRQIGRLSGAPILYFHGCPGSCLEADFLQSSAQLNNLRIISVDRPGVGGSSPQNRRCSVDDHQRLDQWCRDINSLLKALHIERFSIIAYSAGATFALRCVSTFKKRMLKLALVSPFIALTPQSRGANVRYLSETNIRVFVIRKLTALFYLPMCLLRKRLLKARPDLNAYLYKQLPDVDKPVFKKITRIVLFRRNLQRAFKQSIRAVADDLSLSATPLHKTELTLLNMGESLRVWFGDADDNISKQTREGIMALANQRQLNVKEFAGHCLVPDYADEICAYLADFDSREGEQL